HGGEGWEGSRGGRRFALGLPGHRRYPLAPSSFPQREGEGGGGGMMRLRNSTKFARTLRSSPTDAERAIWRIVRGGQIGGLKFRRQYVISPYIVDFICLERRLIVEVDGAQHADRAGHDARRDRY